MRIDLSDLERLDGFADALARLFWCLMAIAFFGTVLGSPGTGLFLLVLGSLAFVGRAGLEDFVRSRHDSSAVVAPSKASAKPARAPAKAVAKRPAKKKPAPADPAEDPGITIYRAKGSRRPRRRSNSAV